MSLFEPPPLKPKPRRSPKPAAKPQSGRGNVLAIDPLLKEDLISLIDTWLSANRWKEGHDGQKAYRRKKERLIELRRRLG